eukprot:TRINITY_DN5507_c0_g1_i4.p1 TRINITY_DN5507_c0_g1~~TRINITY_DN5507_c0_g1_i4.p1  ORF type:complete len:119 (+),score=3.23 TRINITY_DN5507_c0_g1_i4:653-1009(+)
MYCEVSKVEARECTYWCEYSVTTNVTGDLEFTVVEDMRHGDCSAFAGGEGDEEACYITEEARFLQRVDREPAYRVSLNPRGEEVWRAGFDCILGLLVSIVTCGACCTVSKTSARDQLS